MYFHENWFKQNFKLDNNSLVFLGCDSLEIQTGKILLTAKSIILMMFCMIDTVFLSEYLYSQAVV